MWLVYLSVSLSLPSTAAVILSYTAVEEERGRETRQIQGTLLSFFLLVNLSNSRSLFLYTCRLLDRLINQKERQKKTRRLVTRSLLVVGGSSDQTAAYELIVSFLFVYCSAVKAKERPSRTKRDKESSGIVYAWWWTTG